MNRYAAGLAVDPDPARATGEAAGQILDALGDAPPDLLVAFAGAPHADAFGEIVAALRDLLRPATFLGAVMGMVAGGATEVEDGPAVSLLAAALPGATRIPVGLDVLRTADGAVLAGWPPEVPPGATLLLVADPWSFPTDGVLGWLGEQHPGIQVVGGLASGARHPGGSHLAVDDELRRTGAVGVLLAGVPITPVVAQGCSPVGAPFTVTAADGNVLRQLGGQPAVERVRELAAALSDDDRARLEQGLHLGIVVDEQRLDFGRGDFLVRPVLGADPSDGSVTIGDVVEVGQTVQFQVRDAVAADEDLRALLGALAAPPPAAALLFACNGRGVHLFGVPSHDAGAVQEVVGPLPLAGASCAGELGPVGSRNFVHGFTASVALLH